MSVWSDYQLVAFINVSHWLHRDYIIFYIPIRKSIRYIQLYCVCYLKLCLCYLKWKAMFFHWNHPNINLIRNSVLFYENIVDLKLVPWKLLQAVDIMSKSKLICYDKFNTLWLLCSSSVMSKENGGYMCSKRHFDLTLCRHQTFSKWPHQGLKMKRGAERGSQEELIYVFVLAWLWYLCS